MNTTLKRIEDELARQKLEFIPAEQAAAYMLGFSQHLDDLGRLGRYQFRAAVAIAGADVIFAGFTAAAMKAAEMGLMTKPASAGLADKEPKAPAELTGGRQ